MQTNSLQKTKSKQPMKLKDEAFITLERMIINGELEPGRWVSETDLIEASGHKRASVRSAIQRLADQGLVTVVPRRGAQICPVDYTQQFRALELRRVVEALLARSSAKRASEEQRAEFAEIAQGFQEVLKTADQDTMTELDSRFFRLLLKTADNSFASRAMMSVKGLSRRFWVLHYQQYGDLTRMAASYAGVAEAVASGNPENADRAVGKLVDYVEEFTLEVVGFSTNKAANIE